MMRSRRGPATTIAIGLVAVSTALLAAACTQDDDGPVVPEYDPSATEASAEPSSPPSTTASAAGPVDLATVGIPADVPEYERAPVEVAGLTPEDVGGQQEFQVAAAWVTFTRALQAMYTVPYYDEALLRSVATGPVLETYVAEIPQVVSEGNHLEGETAILKMSATLNGNTADLISCENDATAMFDPNGNQIDQPTLDVTWQVDLVQIDGSWLVNDFESIDTCPL